MLFFLFINHTANIIYEMKLVKGFLVKKCYRPYLLTFV